jgi:hypothetical protein
MSKPEPGENLAKDKKKPVASNQIDVQGVAEKVTCGLPCRGAHPS